MSERLSEEDLAAFIGGTTPLPGEVVRMAAELRARRAADLTAAEREALEFIVEEIRGQFRLDWPSYTGAPGHEGRAKASLAIKALARVLGGGE